MTNKTIANFVLGIFISAIISTAGASSCLDLATNAEIARCAQGMTGSGRPSPNKVPVGVTPPQAATSISVSPASTGQPLGVQVNGGPPRGQKKNYFTGSEYAPPTAEERAMQKQRYEQAQAVNASMQRLSNDIDRKHAAEAEVQRQAVLAQQEQQRQEQEYRFRQQQAYEQQRRDAVAEATLRAVQEMADRPPPKAPAPPPPRSMHCNFSNGWCD